MQMTCDGLRSGKHPHGRGEDPKMLAASSCARETPPRAWGRPIETQISSFVKRNTPTGVGKTAILPGLLCQDEKHPHGRGEDKRHLSSERTTRETPPRAWGRHGVEIPYSKEAGNTPTGVGKTA